MKNRGFTLIEILIVIFIIGLASGVIAPSLFNQYEKMKFNQDIMQLKSLLRHTSQKAYYHGEVISIRLDENVLTEIFRDKENKIEFSYLKFKQSNINFNINGNSDIKKITAYISQQPLDIYIEQVF